MQNRLNHGSSVFTASPSMSTPGTPSLSRYRFSDPGTPMEKVKKIWINLFFCRQKKVKHRNTFSQLLIVRNYQVSFCPTKLFYRRDANWFNLALLIFFFQRLLPNNSRDTRPPSPPTLDLIVTRYLREQHAQCTNPVSAGPPFSLIRLVATHLVWLLL